MKYWASTLSTVFLLQATSAIAGNTLQAFDGFLTVDLAEFGDGCNGDCAVQVFAGRQTTIGLENAFGVGDFTHHRIRFVIPTPIWEWPWLDSYMVAATASHDLASVSFGSWTDALKLEGEVGVGKRFGKQTEFEFWAALYLRWTVFPWNDWIKTTAGVSTGLNWATDISPFEVRRSGNGEGSQLLHYLSPEFTFALPDKPNQELTIRYHHRSGGTDFFGPDNIFNNTAAGFETFNIGFRYRF